VYGIANCLRLVSTPAGLFDPETAKTVVMAVGIVVDVWVFGAMVVVLWTALGYSGIAAFSVTLVTGVITHLITQLLLIDRSFAAQGPDWVWFGSVWDYVGGGG